MPGDLKAACWEVLRCHDPWSCQWDDEDQSFSQPLNSVCWLNVRSAFRFEDERRSGLITFSSEELHSFDVKDYNSQRRQGVCGMKNVWDDWEEKSEARKNVEERKTE